MWIRNRFLRVFLLVSVLLAASAAQGSVVYTVVDDSYTSGSMGMVRMAASGAPGLPESHVVTNLGGDHSVYAFRDWAGRLRVLLAQHNFFGQHPDTVWIYDALGDFRAPLKETVWNEFKNSRGVASLGRYLYVTGYNGTEVCKVDGGSNYEMLRSFSFNATAGYDAHGEGIVREGDHLFAIFSEEKGDYPNYDYISSKLVKLNPELEKIGIAELGKNPYSVKAHGGMIYVVSIGGSQQGGGFNPDSVIQRVNPDTMEVKDLLRAGDLGVGWEYDFRDIAFGRDGAVYILAGAYNANWSKFNSRIFVTTLQGLEEGDKGVEYADTTGPGVPWSIEYDGPDDILWCAAGDRLKAFRGAESWEFGPGSLGGNFYSFAVVDAPANPAPGDGGGGCNSAGFSAIFLVALLPLLRVASGKKRS